MSYHILVADHLPDAGWDLLRAAPDATLAGPFATRADLLAALPTADALIIRSTTTVDAALLDAAPRLKVVARAGARLDNVDLDETTRRGVLVLSAPSANVVAVAEHTFAMLLALARHIPQGYNAVRAGEWPRHTMLGFQLHGKQLGVVGFGRLGRAVAERAQAFGMHVLVYDPYVDLALARERRVEPVGFEELLARADIVTLHTNYTAQTHHILNAAALAHMKPSAYLVNCTHAGLVDEQALLAALNNHQIAGAALDVFAVEPPVGNPLTSHPRVLVAPHLNQNTVESQTATAEQIVTAVLDALRGVDYRNAVNLPFNNGVSYQEALPYLQLAAKLGKLQGQLAEGWITRLEVELLGNGLRELVRPVAAVLLSGMLLPVEGRPVNWISAPMLAHAQGITTAQVKGLYQLDDYPNLIACRAYWAGGHRTIGGVLFANGQARVVLYDNFHVDASPSGYVLVLENDDVPGVIGKVGTKLGEAGVNIGEWRYGRDLPGGQAVSFINLDSRPPSYLLKTLETYPEIHRARLVRL